MVAPALNRRWRLRRLAVCSSTELELDRWLRALGPEPDLTHSGLVVVARRQRHGRGQWGRSWQSPNGGLWLSAALHWPGDPAAGAPLALAAALGLALQLESLGLKPEIKWPNDLLIEGRKLAGVLPRLRLQGARVRWAQLGIGLNGTNRPPAGAVSVAQALWARGAAGRCWQGRGFHPQAQPRLLLPRVLAAIGWAQQHADDPSAVLQQVEQRLHVPAGGWLHQGQCWEVLGLTQAGGLRLQRGSDQLELNRSIRA